MSDDVRVIARSGWVALRKASPDLPDWPYATPQDRSAMLADAARVVACEDPRHYASVFPEVLAAMREALVTGRQPPPRPVLVGELDPYSTNLRDALLPKPGSAGWNLHKMLGLSARQYLETFDRENLCTEEWSMPSAKLMASAIATRRRGTDAIIILLGAKVCEAFDRAFRPFSVTPVDDLTLVILPHPGGRWNDSNTMERARDAIRRAGIDIKPETLDLAELPTTDWTDKRPAACSNCLGLVEDKYCPKCGPRPGEAP